MNAEARATLELPRTRERILGELRAAEKHRDAILKLVADCAALDVRPLLWVDNELIPTRELDIPLNIREAYADAARSVATLQQELYEATR